MRQPTAQNYDTKMIKLNFPNVNELHPIYRQNDIMSNIWGVINNCFYLLLGD
jgi:hypothetical protein